MTEAYTELSTDFTTADTEGPVSINFSGDRLELSFTNFRTPIQRVAYHDVRALSWIGWEDTSPAISPDRIYQVRGSRFLAPWERFSVGEVRFVHFKLGFNAQAKYLDVIATRME
ncbi:MAG TPA: hypothetical protein VHO24_03660, partial [Opitutaceae bacterium]|nr:hypothetical protein [Opitutaceae bacterium]